MDDLCLGAAFEVREMIYKFFAFLDYLTNELLAEWDILLAIGVPLGFPQNNERQQIRLQKVIQVIRLHQPRLVRLQRLQQLCSYFL